MKKFFLFPLICLLMTACDSPNPQASPPMRPAPNPECDPYDPTCQPSNPEPK